MLWIWAFLFYGGLSNDLTYTLTITSSNDEIKSIETSATGTAGAWSFDQEDATCEALSLLGEQQCEAVPGCKYDKNHEDNECHSDVIYARKKEYPSGYALEILPPSAIFCTSWVNAPAVNLWSKAGKGILYLLTLLYLFLGVGICADIFMSAIEVITSSTTKVTVTDKETGTTTELEAQVWNETVANLTLLALGSSAPEILLATLETCMALGEPAPVLGSATIVGSAAFNLFVIIAVCMVSVPVPGAPGADKDESGIRRVKELGVFAITAFSSVFAYMWLYFCLAIWTPDQVTLTEALITFAFFPVLVGVAYGQDTKWKCCGNKSTGPNERIKLINAIHDNPDAKDSDIIHKLPPPKRSYMVYRVNAMRHINGKKPVINETHANGTEGDVEMTEYPDDMKTGEIHQHHETTVQFVCKHYAVKEDAGHLNVTVIRKGDLSKVHRVGYQTADGTAEGSGDSPDYVHTEGTLIFAKEETHKRISVKINEDEEVEENENFYILLMDPEGQDFGLGRTKVCEVTIIDVSSPGVVGFGDKSITVQESIGKVVIPLVREDGAMGKIHVDFMCQEGTAVPGKDYNNKNGTITFEPNMTDASIEIDIINNNEMESRDRTFSVLLVGVRNENNSAKLNSDATECRIFVSDNEKYAQKVKRILSFWESQKGGSSLGSANWPKQFKDAAEAPDPGCCSYLMHTISLPWKMLFACIPPTHYAGGWVTFFCSLAATGIVTMIIGEVAGSFGCMVGMPKAIVAITVVALGTSMPDTFASRTATQMSPDADAAIGNVTGSNSVNVFLGLGLPWLVGSIYAIANDIACVFPDGKAVEKCYNVPQGSLGPSLVIFIPCAVVCILSLFARRKLADGELGGPSAGRWGTAAFYVFLWFLFILMAALYEAGTWEL